MPPGRPHYPHARGRYLMQRGWQEHPVFPREPFTAREAWEWLIAEAFWKEGRTRAGQFVVDLSRGQLCASIRFLAQCWQWTPSKAERFLKRLKTEAMIETRCEAGINIITICNYDKLQMLSHEGDTASDARGDTATRRARDNKEKPQEHYAEKNSEESLSLFPPLPPPVKPKRKSSDPPGHSPEFEEFWNLYPRHNGSKKEAFKHYQTKVKQGVKHEIIIAGVRRYVGFIASKNGEPAFVKHAHRWLSNECWAIDYVASHATGGTTAGDYRKQSESSRYIDSARTIIEERIERAGRLAQPTDL